MRTDPERPERSFAGRLLTSLIVCGLAAGAAGAHVRSVQEGRQLQTQPSSVVLSAELERIAGQFREIASPRAPAAQPVDYCAWSICDVAPAASAETPAPIEARVEPQAPQGADTIRTGS